MAVRAGGKGGEKMNLPEDIDAEKAVLGSALLEPDALDIGVERLSASAFMGPGHAVLFGALVAMNQAGTPVDLVTIKNELIRTGQLEAVGGIEYLADLVESVPSAAGIGNYIDILEAHRQRRALIQAGHELRQRATENDADPTTLAAEYRARLEAVGSGNGQLGHSPILTCLADVEPREVKWLWSGRIPLGRITLLVGRPGEGKSFLTTDIAARVTTGSPWPDGRGNAPKGSVIIISAEDDPADTIRPRLDAHHADARRVHLLYNRV